MRVRNELRIRLKSRARELFFTHWVLLMLSAAILWIVSQIQLNVQRLQQVPQETIEFLQATPGFETMAETLANMPTLDVPIWQIMAVVALISFLYSLLDYGFSALALHAVKAPEVPAETKALDVDVLPALEIFSKFKEFWRWTLFYIIWNIRVVLWSMLFVIPGIIAAISYSQAVYLMTEDPDLRPAAAIRKSVLLMKGRKFEYFTILLSFLGFYLLASLTFGVSTLYSIPYSRMTFAGYYRELIAEQPVPQPQQPQQPQQPPQSQQSQEEAEYVHEPKDPRT